MRAAPVVAAILVAACASPAGSGTDSALPEQTGGVDTGEADEPASPPGDKPEILPTPAAMSLFSVSSPFNVALADDAPIDPRSAAYVTRLASAAPLVLNLRRYSTTVFLAGETTPRHEVALACGPAWELGVQRLVGVPIPAYAAPTQDAPDEAPPSGCGEDSTRDDFMVVLDLAARCEYDFWQMRREGDAWVASWGNAIGLDSDGVFPAGVSARGSGFAFLGGVIFPDELLEGRIAHALAFSYPHTRTGGPVPPATDSDGESTDPDALPEGARLRLDPALDLDALPLTPVERAIAGALQTYGMILVDNGGDFGIGIYAVDPSSFAVDPYLALGLTEDHPFLAGIPLASLRVLRLPTQDSGWRERLRLTDTGCNRFE